MKTKIQILLLLLSFGIFISCRGNDTPENETSDNQEQNDENNRTEDSTATLSDIEKDETKNDNEPKSIRLNDELSLEERFLEVIEDGGEASSWVADDEYQSVFAFSKEKNRFKYSFKKGKDKYEGDWKFEGQLFSIKIDGDEWNPIPLTVVDRETLVMMNLEFKAEK